LSECPRRRLGYRGGVRARRHRRGESQGLCDHGRRRAIIDERDEGGGLDRSGVARVCGTMGEDAPASQGVKGCRCCYMEDRLGCVHR